MFRPIPGYDDYQFCHENKMVLSTKQKIHRVLKWVDGKVWLMKGGERHTMTLDKIKQIFSQDLKDLFTGLGVVGISNNPPNRIINKDFNPLKPNMIIGDGFTSEPWKSPAVEYIFSEKYIYE